MRVGSVSSKVSGFTNLLTSDKALIVGASVLLSAVATSLIGPYVARIPGIGAHPFIFYLIVGFIVFFISGMVGGKLMYLLQGLALGTVVQGLLTFPAVRQAQASILARTGR